MRSGRFNVFFICILIQWVTFGLNKNNENLHVDRPVAHHKTQFKMKEIGQFSELTVSIFLDTLVMLATSFVIASMYGWFVQKPFGLPPLDTFQVLGIYFFASFLYSYKKVEGIINALSGEDEPEDSSMRNEVTMFIQQIIALLLWYITGYFVSWVIHA